MPRKPACLLALLLIRGEYLEDTNVINLSNTLLFTGDVAELPIYYEYDASRLRTRTNRGIGSLCEDNKVGR